MKLVLSEKLVSIHTESCNKLNHCFARRLEVLFKGVSDLMHSNFSVVFDLGSVVRVQS